LGVILLPAIEKEGGNENAVELEIERGTVGTSG
jgi:hypothetical protein